MTYAWGYGTTENAAVFDAIEFVGQDILKDKKDGVQSATDYIIAQRQIYKINGEIIYSVKVEFA